MQERDFTKSSIDMGMSVEEASAFLFRTALENRSSHEWTTVDTGGQSYSTVRVSVAALKRLREAIERK